MNRLPLILVCLALAGCATYRPLPLAVPPPSPSDLSHLTVDARAMPGSLLAAHRFDPSDGLDIVEVAMVAVVNNGDLKVARDDAAVAHAQAFSAGLLPDPQLALSGDLSNTGGANSPHAYSFGLSYDINALLMRASTHGAAQADAHKTDLNLLWQEWQVIAQVQLLFVKLVHAERLNRVLDATQALFADRVRRTQIALQRGLLTSDAVTPNIAALQDVERQQFDLKRQTNQNKHDLNALLGLAPDTALELRQDSDPGPIDVAEVEARLRAVPRLRPDLLALEAGYGAQDQRYRGALLGQFPALNVGLTRARDSSGVGSTAIGVSLSLPLLNRNRGAIAMEHASRQKLFDEYQQRVRTTRNEAHRILAEQALIVQQLTLGERALEALSAVLARSETAFRAGGVDALVYANARAALLAKQLERINLQQSLLEQRIGLNTLLGIGIGALPNSESTKK